MDLKNVFPNYVSAINHMKDTTDLTQCKSSPTVISHGMSYVVYGNKLADIYIDLNKYDDFVYISFATYKGLSEKAKTTGEKIHEDLPVEEWIGVIAEVMNKHNANPDHAQLVMEFTRKRVGAPSGRSVHSQKSGCILMLLVLLIPIIFSVLLIN